MVISEGGLARCRLGEVGISATPRIAVSRSSTLKTRDKASRFTDRELFD